MRRKDREITDFNEIMKIIDSCDVCRLAIFNEDYPYIVPLNFGTEIIDNQLYLYFHSALEGKKLDLIQKNNHVSFEMDCDHNILLYKERMSCTMGYASVIGHGIIEFVEEEKKLDALKRLMKHYHSQDFQFNTDMMKVTMVYRLKVLEMTGKRRNNIHPEEKEVTYIHMESYKK